MKGGNAVFIRNLVSRHIPELRLLVFGFLLTFLSGFGQTFFIGLFSNELRDAAALSHGAFGAIYSAATLASALCMFWAGAWIDRIALPVYAAASVLILSAGYLLLSFAGHFVWLAAALFLLRFAGQGLLSHTAVTSTARSFEHARGKAMAIVRMGHPTGEAVLPLAAVLIAVSAGWRFVWTLAAAILLIAIPGIVALLSTHSVPAWKKAAASTETIHTARAGPADASRAEVLRDRRFYLLLPTLLLPGFLMTGVFIYQGHLVDEKGWELTWFAAMFLVFAGAQVAGMLGAGPLIDRLSARRLLPFYLLPLGAACVFINLTDDRLIAIPFMAGAGLTAGAATSITTAAWVEIYGVGSLGAIHALSVSIMILSTALAPAIFGWLLERGVGFGALLLVSTAGIAAAAIMARTAIGSGLRNRLHDA